MNKQIITIGYEIPGFSDNYRGLSDPLSLMDADIVLISPQDFRPVGDWVEFTSSDGGCYNVDASKKFIQKIEHLRKELSDHLNDGKNVFIFMTEVDALTLAAGVSSPRKGPNTYSTYSYSNYNFLPIELGKLTVANGNVINFTGESLFSNFYKNFKDKLKYEMYVENGNPSRIIFTGKNKNKILGAIYSARNGHIVTLPVLPYNYGKFVETKVDNKGKEKEFWNKKGLEFGNKLVNSLIEIDSQLATKSGKTPTPAWASDKQFIIASEEDIRGKIEKNIEKITSIKQENEILEGKLAEEMKLKDLLFEQGKPLEDAVIEALKILGYEAENYNDGTLEMDQVIESPEGYRYIGECEGKDNKEINITKFRQLVDALNEDFTRDEIEERALGILFGNTERLIEPKKRKLDFTIKCKSGAEREKIALVRTMDLFNIAKWLKENNSNDFKEKCRKAIYDGLGKIVQFPPIPE